MADKKTRNPNGLCYSELDGLKIGDVFSYVSERGILRHYIISFLHKRMGVSFATIIFPDGYSETIDTKSVKKDKFIKNIKNWSQISVEYKNEASMYLDCADIPSELASEPNKTVFCDEIDSF